jgi:hypothetical protein
MAAAANRDLKAEPRRKSDGVHDIRHTAASGDQCRSLVDQPVVKLSRFLVALVRWSEELSSKGGAKVGGGAGDRCDGRHDTVSRFDPSILNRGPARGKSEEFR